MITCSHQQKYFGPFLVKDNQAKSSIYKAIRCNLNLFNPFMHNVVKWPKILLKYCGVHTARFLKYVWPFYNIMHKRVNYKSYPPGTRWKLIKRFIYLFTTSFHVQKKLRKSNEIRQRYKFVGAATELKEKLRPKKCSKSSNNERYQMEI